MTGGNHAPSAVVVLCVKAVCQSVTRQENFITKNVRMHPCLTLLRCVCLQVILAMLIPIAAVIFMTTLVLGWPVSLAAPGQPHQH